MNSYQKDATEILDIPIAPSIGNNTMTFDSATPGGLTFTVTVATNGKIATCLVSGGTYPNEYECKVYFNLSNGGKRAARFRVTMLAP